MPDAALHTADTAESRGRQDAGQVAPDAPAAAPTSIAITLQPFIFPSLMIRAQAATVLIVFAGLLLSASAGAQTTQQPRTLQAPVAATPSSKRPTTRTIRNRETRDGQAENRLIEVYRLIGQVNSREALRKAESLVTDHPNFQLAQLVYGDLLSGRTRALRSVGDVPDTAAKAAAPMLAELRQESELRLRALRERPAPGMVPSQFLTLSSLSKHAIAVDASRARLYLFENTPGGLKLLADYYISVGKSGIEKSLEGDLRTPLGVYFVTSNLDPTSLKDFYGSGALPINYPNQLDLKRGKTGGGIWLHGAPPTQFSRAPLATDGCVVLANPDLERIIKTVAVRSTPVVIAANLKWVAQQSLGPDVKAFDDVLQGWHKAKVSGDMERLTSWYAPDFTSFGKTLAEWKPGLQAELKQLRGRDIQLKDVSYLRWTDSADTMVVTFGELIKGAKTGRTKRQYWTRQGSQWKIFFEGDI
jgi:L,D-transpeptidase YnhG